MVTIERCKDLLGEDAKTMTNEEIQELRDLLYMLAHMANEVGLFKTNG